MNKLLVVGKMALGVATSIGVASLVRPKLEEMEPKDPSKFEKICIKIAEAGIQYAIVGFASAALFTMVDNSVALFSKNKTE